MSLFSCLHENERYAARDDEVRMERRGKSSPIGWKLSDAVNSIRSNTVERTWIMCLRSATGPVVLEEVAGAVWQQAA